MKGEEANRPCECPPPKREYKEVTRRRGEAATSAARVSARRSSGELHMDISAQRAPVASAIRQQGEFHQRNLRPVPVLVSVSDMSRWGSRIENWNRLDIGSKPSLSVNFPSLLMSVDKKPAQAPKPH